MSFIENYSDAVSGRSAPTPQQPSNHPDGPTDQSPSGGPANQEPPVIPVAHDAAIGTSSNGFAVKPDLIDVTELFKPGREHPITSITSFTKRPREGDRKYKDHGLVLVRKEDENGDSMGIELVINSPLIQKALRTVTASFAVLNLAADPIIIKKPYEPLFHFREQLSMYAESSERSAEERVHLKVLTEEFIPKYLKKTMDIYKEEVPKGRVPWNHLWTLFRPEDDVLVRTEQYEEIHRVMSCETRAPSPGSDGLFYIQTWRWGYNNDKFGPCTETIVIPEFAHSRRIQLLSCFPMESLSPEEKEKIYKRMINRGHQWRELIKPMHRNYNGLMWASPMNEQPRTMNSLEIIHMEGRIMLDHALHVQESSYLADQLIGAHGYTMNIRELGEDAPLSNIPAMRWSNSRVQFVPAVSRAGEGRKIIFNKAQAHRDDDSYQMTDEEALLCPARTRGFALDDKRWAFFLVEGISLIDFREEAYQSLELDNRYKETIRALVEMHEVTSDRFDDLVTGKGKGVLVSLEGPPGSGKTLTAEGIAELTHRPLYSISTGELGTQASRAEKSLTAIFRRAAKWKSVLLLDEADLFLTKRTGEDMERNAFVTIFLRLLEYYRGIMFLTSNRVEEFDPAFDSRIHLRVKFERPDGHTRAAIWANFLRNNDDCKDWTPEVFDRLGNELEINGREIKNTIRTSLAVAQFKKEQLSEQLIKTVYQLSRTVRKQ